MTVALTESNRYRVQLLRARRGQGPLAVFVLGLSGLGLSGCQKQNIKINGTSLPALLAADRNNPLGVPIDLPDALSAARTWFQSRGVINLTITGQQFAQGTLQLFNDSTQAKIIDTSASSLKLDDLTENAAGSSFELLDGGYSLALTLYPLDPSNTGKFAYGSNALRLIAGSKEAPVQAKKDIDLHDFSYVTMGFSAFAEPQQSQGGWQAQVDYLTSPVVVSDQSQMTTGSIAVFNW